MNIERERGQCKYPLLFQPLKVNKIVLKNRIISAPLGSNTDKSLSGIGMIIRGTSGSVDDTRMRLTPGTYCFADLFQAAKVREEVSLIRQRGAKAEFELCHCGQFAVVEEGDYAIGPVSFVRWMKSQINLQSRHVTQKSMGLMGYCFISDTDGFRHNFFLRILIKEKMSMGGALKIE